MNRWYLQSLASLPAIIVFGVMIFLVDAAGAATWLAWGQFLEVPLQHRLMGPIFGVTTGMCVLVGALLGFVRLARYPLAIEQHRDLLAISPWTPGRRTPFGPWHPVLQDTVPLAILMLLAGLHSFPIVRTFHYAGDFQTSGSQLGTMLAIGCIPAVSFLFSWTLCGYLLLLKRGVARFLPPIIGLAMLWHIWCRASFPVTGIVFITAATSAVVVVWRRLTAALRQLPELRLQEVDMTTKRSQVIARYDTMSPQCVKPGGVELHQQLAERVWTVGLAIVLWAAMLPWEGAGLFIAAAAVSLLALLRVICFTDHRTSHLGLMARIGTRQLIVPEYDRVWVPSLIMVAAALIPAAATACLPGLVPIPLAGVLTLVIPVVISLRSGPDYTEWSLTAPCAWVPRRGSQRPGQQIVASTSAEQQSAC